MNNSIVKPRNLPRQLAFLGLFAALAVPSVSAAAPLTVDEPTPFTATDDDDPPCEESVIALEVDVATGDVYIVDAAGELTLTDNSLNIYFGSRSRVLVDIEYTNHEWTVVVAADDDPIESLLTRGGSLRYYIDAEHDEYVFSSTQATGMSTMMNMTPIIPDIILQPDKNCPPST